MTAGWLTMLPIALLVAGCSASTASSRPAPTAEISASPAPTEGGLTSGGSGTSSATSATTTPSSPTPATTFTAGGVLHLVTEEGPTCPVQRVGQPPCVKPLAASVEVTASSGGAGMVVSTGDSGSADVNLAAGTYTMHPLSPGGGSQSLPRPPADQSATVTAGATVTVTMVWDTGIR